MSAPAAPHTSAAPSADAEAPTWTDWFDARLNPILVKDIRCWLRSKRFLAIFFAGMVLAQVLTVNFTLMAGYEQGVGAGLYLFLIGGLGFVLGGAVPFLIQEKFSEELENRSTELALISRMTPGLMVRGKLLSGTAATLLFFSAVGPSLMLAYLLGGLDLLTVAYSVLVLLALSLQAMLLAVLLVAAIGRKRARAVVSFLLFANGVGLAAMLVGIVQEVRRSTPFDDAEFWFANAFAALHLVLGGIFLYFVATSRLSFPADNRDSRPRLSLTAWVSSTVAAFFCAPFLFDWFAVRGPDMREAVFIGVLSGLVLFCIGVLFLMHTPEDPSPRVRAHWRANPLITVFFYPGRGRLGAYMLAHCAAFAGLAPFCGEWELTLQVWGTIVCAVAALGTGMWFHAMLAGYWERRGRQLPMVVVVLLVLILWTAIGVTVMVVVWSATHSHREDFVLLLSPFTAVGYIWDIRSGAGERFVYLLLIMGPPAAGLGLRLWIGGMFRALQQHWQIRAAMDSAIRPDDVLPPVDAPAAPAGTGTGEAARAMQTLPDHDIDFAGDAAARPDAPEDPSGDDGPGDAPVDPQTGGAP